ncbi:hypothetical protein OSB04_021982 [Centaurea solstitialis]|uniref:Coilin n=1 Tax=Centaurea solstitialis TaxID=347529 RepID=A0AA38WGS5_9ASTR|nr:hypothetical protein OSB04_021982 [Centaurea solstitialis]
METTPSLRLRLVFEDRSILSRNQRSEGMDHAWFLLKSQQHRTISDVCAHLLHIFKLGRSCPNGILLSMDGFVLPSFESTEMLKDKEKGGDAVEAVDAGNLLDKVENDGLDPKHYSHDLFLYVTCSLFANHRKKKRRLGVLDDAEDEANAEEIDNGNNGASCSRKISSKKKILNCNSKPNEETAAKSSKKVKSPSVVKRSEQLQQNIEEVNQVSTAPEAKKMASRSARRKKAKRQWMKEIAKISKKKPQSYSKPEVTKAENKEASGHPKGLLHWKQAGKKPVHTNSTEQAVGTGVVSTVTRPGHIRFEPLDEDQAPKQTGVSYETPMRNGSNSKRKGKKWSAERFSASRRNELNDAKRINKEAFKMLFMDAQVPVIEPNDFDKLPPCCSPKEGDVIAYRLLELSSAWIPEFSSFRVGRISYYDAKDIVLIPVPEYPIASDKINEDGPNGSLYGEDGTLEINYSALVDVRNIKEYEPDAIEAVSNGVTQTPMSGDKDGTDNMVVANENNIDLPKDSNPGDGEVSPWDQISKGNSTNADMAGPSHSNMVSTEMNPCSSGAAGPVWLLQMLIKQGHLNKKMSRRVVLRVIHG